MLYWLLMMVIMVIISNNDKLQMVSTGCIRRLIQTMIWLTVSEFYQVIWPILIRRFNSTASSSSSQLLNSSNQNNYHHLHTSISANCHHHNHHLQQPNQQVELVPRLNVCGQQASR